MIEPMYQSEDVTIFCGDARKIIPCLPAEGEGAQKRSYDLLLTDPPYGNGYKTNSRDVLPQFDGIHGDDDESMVLEVLKLAWRGLRINRHGYVFGPITPAQVVTSEVGGMAHLIWDKSSMSAGDLTIPWGKSHEPIWFGVKRYPGKRSEKTGQLAARLRRGTVLRVNRSGETSRSHPTQKPVALLTQLIEMSSNPDELILDPFMGTGSSLVAALLEGRRAIGIEIDSSYCREAISRIQKAQKLIQELRSLK